MSGRPAKRPLKFRGGQPVWRCTNCGREGTAKSGIFPRAKHTANGLSSWCTVCHRRAVTVGRRQKRYVQ